MKSKTKTPERITVDDYGKLVLEKVSENHLWLNAFECIYPSDELKIRIGEWVLRLLRDKDNILPSKLITDNNPTVRELAELTPILYVSINKS